MGVSTDQLKEMRFQRGKLIDEGRALIDKATEEGREVTKEERAKYEDIYKQQAALKSKIELEERQCTAEKEVAGEIDRIQRQLELEARGKKSEAEPPVARPDHTTPEQREKMAKEAAEKRGGEYSRMYSNYLRKQASELELRALQKDISTSGGYLVAPETMANELIANVTNAVVIRGLASVKTVPNAQSLGIPRLRNRLSSFTWGGELTLAAADTSLDFGKRAFFPHPGSCLALVSEDLIRMAFLNVQSIVNEELARDVSEGQETAFMTGHGVNQPLGIFTASNDGIDTSRDMATDNTSTKPTFNNLKRCKHALKSAYKTNAKWLAHPDFYLETSLIKDGNGRYIQQDNPAIGEPDTLLGFPTVESYFAPNTFTTGLYVAAFGDFSQYQIVDTLDLSIQVLDQVFYATNQVGYKGRIYCDGAPKKAEAFVRSKLG